MSRDWALSRFSRGQARSPQGSGRPAAGAEEFARQAGKAVTDGERARLWFLSLAEWYEEGARAVLTLDHARLHHAVRQEGGALILAHRSAVEHCSLGVVTVPYPISYLTYVAGQWDGRGGLHGTLPNQAELANTLLKIAEDRRHDARNPCVP